MELWDWFQNHQNIIIWKTDGHDLQKYIWNTNLIHRLMYRRHHNLAFALFFEEKYVLLVEEITKYILVYRWAPGWGVLLDRGRLYSSCQWIPLALSSGRYLIPVVSTVNIWAHTCDFITPVRAPGLSIDWHFLDTSHGGKWEESIWWNTPLVLYGMPEGRGSIWSQVMAAKLPERPHLQIHK